LANFFEKLEKIIKITLERPKKTKIQEFPNFLLKNYGQKVLEKHTIPQSTMVIFKALVVWNYSLYLTHGLETIMI